MNARRHREHGITLLELLISMAILSLVMGGLYGVLDAANRTYIDTRALVERQQTARQVLNYLLFRLREVDGSGLVKDPRYCKDCHTPNIDENVTVDAKTVPCPQDVRIPRQTIYINLSTVPLASLAGVDSIYQNLSGYNSVTFWADLLPVTGMNDEFTDSPSSAAADTTYSSSRNGIYDLTVDEDGDGEYDPERDSEVLYFDQNDNGRYDYYGELWTLGLELAPDSKSWQLVESLSFTETLEKGGVLDTSANNQSTYTAYTTQAVAYGVTGLGIKPLLRFTPANYPTPKDTKLQHISCGAGRGDPNIDTCHGNKVSISGDSDCPGSNCWLNIYENETSFSYERFVTTHPSWNIRALSLEVATTEPQLRKFMKMKQILIPRNLEVNQEYYVGSSN